MLLGLVGRTDFAQILFFRVCVGKRGIYVALFLLPPLLLLLLSARLRTVSFCVGEGDPPSLMNGLLGSQSTAGGDKSG